jgi:ferredoxin--NADP+ reductase
MIEFMTEPNMVRRVAVIGSGPAGFYTAEALFKSGGAGVSVDLIDRLPVPFGLVRGGVAPDHQKIKGVVKIYNKIAANHGFRFFGNVTLGTDIQVTDLEDHYHQVVYAFGCESHGQLGIEGEGLSGVFDATDFVGWYNAHPDHQHHDFDLKDAKCVGLVGNGDVAMDVARILLSSPDELAKTDITDAVLRESKVTEVVMLGRRGPAQAAFSPKEIKAVADLPGVDVIAPKGDVELDEESAAWLEQEGSRKQQRNVDFFRERGATDEGSEPKKLRCRFLVSPTALLGEDGRLTAVRVNHMQLAADDQGTLRPNPTGTTEDLPVDKLFKSIGYRGTPVPGVPFEEKRGIVPNVEGRVVEQPGGEVRVGHYAAGWCKRGPTGLIGTNSPDAKATVVEMEQDFGADNTLVPSQIDIAELLSNRGIDAVTWADWKRLDQWELEQGEQRGKLRHKLTSTAEIMTTIKELRSGCQATESEPA